MFHPMMWWARGGSLKKRRILACSILLAVLACATVPSASQAASRKIRGVGFSTLVPGNWKTGKSKTGNSHVYGAASPKSKRSATVNLMQVGISVIPVVDLERQLGRKLPASPEELLGLVMSPPQQAQNVQLTAPFRASTLDGRRAASGAVQFNYNGALLLQSNTVAVRRGLVYVIEFDLDMALQFQGLPVLAGIHRHWRWH